MHVDSPRVAAGHQTRTGWCAYAAGYIEARKTHALGSHSVDVRGAMLVRAETAEVAIAQIITENDNEVWLLSCTTYTFRET